MGFHTLHVVTAYRIANGVDKILKESEKYIFCVCGCRWMWMNWWIVIRASRKQKKNDRFCCADKYNRDVMIRDHIIRIRSEAIRWKLWCLFRM